MIGQNGFGVVVSFASGWFLAQLIKIVLNIKKKGLRGALRRSTQPGGMPSGHTAGFVAMTTFVGLAEGLDSTAFGIAAGVTIVIMYDATHVRHAVGELGEAMHHAMKRVDTKMKAPKIVKGHKLVEVLVGALLGMILGFCVFLLL